MNRKVLKDVEIEWMPFDYWCQGPRDFATLEPNKFPIAGYKIA